jgi:hypothetical protein
MNKQVNQSINVLINQLINEKWLKNLNLYWHKLNTIRFFPLFQIQFPIQTLQSWPQTAQLQRSRLLRTIAGFLWKESPARHPRYTRSSVQRHIDRCGRLWSDVLRPRLSNAGGDRCGTMCVHLSLVLWGEM